MVGHPFTPLGEAHALGTLDGDELTQFQGHLATGCEACLREIETHESMLGTLAASAPHVPPAPGVKDRLLDLADAPRLPIELGAYDWKEPFPGFRYVVLRQEPSRRLTACLLWAKPGSRYPAHRHGGEEAVLVLQGTYRDEQGDYGPGQIARRPAGSVHSVEVPPGDDCISYIVSYGDHEIL